MTEEQTTEQAVATFYNLSGDDLAKLKDLNTRIQQHKGKWGVRMGGEKNSDGSIEMPYTQNDPLITELIFDFMLEKRTLNSLRLERLERRLRRAVRVPRPNQVRQYRPKDCSDSH